jgi:hypothetical protein
MTALKDWTRMLVLFIAGAAALSCEDEISIAGTVTVPVDVQRQFSAAMRGRLVMQAFYADTGSIIGGETMYIFCEPGTADLKLPFQIFSFGCVRETDVHAIAMPLSGSHAEIFTGLPCGQVSAMPAGADGTSAIAHGRALAFEGRKGGRCTSGTAVADVAVALTPRPLRFATP